MCAKGWCSAHVCMDSVLHACAVSVQCTCVHGRCNVSMHRVSAVHVCAWLVQCMHGDSQCSIHGLLGACVHTAMRRMRAQGQLSVLVCAGRAAWAAQLSAPVCSTT